MPTNEEIYSARWIVPVTSPPIHGGWIRLQDGLIVELGESGCPAGASDLGDVAILPGLVNAHTHLEFSDCEQPLGTENMPLADWIGHVIRSRGVTTTLQKTAAIKLGIEECISAGVRLIGEIATPPLNYASVVGSSIDYVAFAEVLGLNDSRSAERLVAAEDHNSNSEHGGWSPHAPYSTTWLTIEDTVRRARQTGLPLAMHVAESPDERELIQHGTGKFAKSLKAIGVWQDGLFPWNNRSFPHLIQLLSKAPRSLLIHCNDLRNEEIEELAQHGDMSVVYCPRTHAYFGHSEHPCVRMMERGVRVALGTDSRASNPDLNLWGEVQFLLNRRSDIEPQNVLKMATANGADALGKERFGRIEKGCTPGLGIVTTEATTLAELHKDFATHCYTPLKTDPRTR